MFRKSILLTKKWTTKNGSSSHPSLGLLSPPNVLATQRKIHQFHSYSCQNMDPKKIKDCVSSDNGKNSKEDEVLFHTTPEAGIIILNRPKVLNVLNLSMYTKITATLKEWETTKKFVIVKGAGGKAFSAGGDVVASAKALLTGSDYSHRFVRTQYLLNGLIGCLKIPYVALIDGITMGGGAGVSVHGDYRVATEKTVFSMPESAIGFFPDVGASYFLPRLRIKRPTEIAGGRQEATGGGVGIGPFLGLTAHRLHGVDNLWVGIATHMCSRSSLPNLEKDLLSMDTSGLDSSSIRGAIEKILQKYTDDCPEAKKPFSLEKEKILDKIDSIFNGPCVEEMVTKLKKMEQDPWASHCVTEMEDLPPTSLKVTLELLRRGAKLDLYDCLRMEYRVAHNYGKGPNLLEGVRALLIDKDKTPRWVPSELAKVSKVYVDSVFVPLPSKLELRFDDDRPCRKGV